MASCCCLTRVPSESQLLFPRCGIKLSAVSPRSGFCFSEEHPSGDIQKAAEYVEERYGPRVVNTETTSSYPSTDFLGGNGLLTNLCLAPASDPYMQEACIISVCVLWVSSMPGTEGVLRNICLLNKEMNP